MGEEIISIVERFFGQNQMIIPVYQRNYSWKEENCVQLFGDLITLVKYAKEGKKRKHFLGAVVYTSNEEEQRIIIDGQQRLTTVALLLIALRDAIKDGELALEEDSDVPSLIRQKLKDILNGSRPTLIPVEKDREYYIGLLERKHENGESNINCNYNLFRELLRSKDIKAYTADDLYKAMLRLWVMPIRLSAKEGDDAQAVFESINTTGLSLTDADCIRNYILMNRSLDEQNQIYSDYWSKIEDCVGVDKITNFFKDYITLQNCSSIKEDEVYLEFKKLYPNIKFPSKDSTDQLEEIKIYAEVYGGIIKSDLSYVSDEATKRMYYINCMKQTTSYPFIMRILRGFKQEVKEFSVKDVEDVLSVLDNYMIRRMACGLTSTGQNKMMPLMFKSISSLEGDYPFVEKMKYYLLKRKESSEYKRDDIVRQNLAELNLYKKDACNYILSIVNYNNKDSSDVYPRINSEDLTVDHIMPQTLNHDWKRDLGDDYQRIFDTWLHRMGNLTLTAYNSRYQNESYPVKRNNPEFGYVKSDLELNSYMKELNHTKWTETEMKERNGLLVEKFIKNRPEITTSYIPIRKSEKSMSISDGDFQNLTHMRVYGYQYENEQEVILDYAYFVFIDILKKMCDINPEGMRDLAKNKVKNTPGYGTIFEEDSEDREEIGHGLYAFGNYDNEKKFNILRELALYLNIDGSKFVIFYKPIKKDMSVDI